MKALLLLLSLALANLCFAADDIPENIPDNIPDRIIGDVGGAVYSSNLHIGTDGAQTIVLPYAFADYKRIFVRIDQVGVKTAKVGYGYLELTGKINLGNYDIHSAINGYAIGRSNPIPIGLGSFQETPIGAFFINAYYDFGKSKGSLYELQYFAELKTVKNIVLYPQIGIERQSNQYANYYYGLSSSEASLTGYSPYTANATNNLNVGAMLEIPVVDNWYINIYAKRKWMGGNINNSPVMNRSFQDNIFTAVAYRFK